MNDTERLYLLRDLLMNPELRAGGHLLKLSYQIESILQSIDFVPDSIKVTHSNLWVDLEILGVMHQESQTDVTPAELADLSSGINRLLIEVETEIFNSKK